MSWRRAARSRSIARSTVRTTGGATASTVRCCRRRASPRLTTSIARATRLIPVPIEEWHGWLMINASGHAPPVGAFLSGIEPHVADHEPERLVVGATHSYELAANWKLVMENYQECLHCPNIHPELCRVSPPTSGENAVGHDGFWVGGWMDLMPHAADDVGQRRVAHHAAASAAGRRSPASRLHRGAAEPARQPAPGLRDDAPPGADRAGSHGHRVPVALRVRGGGEPTASIHRSPSTSGTSPTVRTGRRARRCSAACRRADTARDRSRPRRTAWPISSASWPAPTSRGLDPRVGGNLGIDRDVARGSGPLAPIGEPHATSPSDPRPADFPGGHRRGHRARSLDRRRVRRPGRRERHDPARPHDDAGRLPRRRRALRHVVRVHRRGRVGRLDRPAARRADRASSGAATGRCSACAQEVAPPAPAAESTTADADGCGGRRRDHPRDADRRPRHHRAGGRRRRGRAVGASTTASSCRRTRRRCSTSTPRAARCSWPPSSTPSGPATSARASATARRSWPRSRPTTRGCRCASSASASTPSAASRPTCSC